LFPNARKLGDNTSTIVVPATEAEEWIAAGCPTPGEMPRDGMIDTVRVVEIAERAGLDITRYLVCQVIRRGAFPSASKTKASGRQWEVKEEEARKWIAAGCPVSRAMEQADETDKRNWHLAEGRLASVAGLDE
jgi:hypothetical protein